MSVVRVRLALAMMLLSVSPVRAQSTPPTGTANVDRFGDPLPAGALYRIGTLRLNLGGWIGNIAIAPDGKRLAATTCSGPIRTHILETSGGREIACFPGGKFYDCLAYAADSKVVACNWEDRFVFVDAATGKVRKELDTKTVDAVFAPDGKSLTAIEDRGYRDYWLRRWDSGRDEPGNVWQVPPPPRDAAGRAWEVQVRLSVDGKRLATVATGPWGAKEQTRLFRVYDTAGGKEVGRWTVSAAADVSADLSCPNVRPEFSPDGKYVAVRCDWQSIRVWEAATGKEAAHLAAETHRQTDRPRQVRFTLDGASLICESKDGLSCWDWRAGKKRRDYPDVRMPVALFPDGKTMAASAPWGMVRLLDLDSGKDRCPLPRPAAPFVFSRDGRLAAWVEGRELVLGDAATGSVTRRWQTPVSHLLAFAPDGKSIASVDRHRVHLWDTASGRLIRDFVLQDREAAPDVIRFSPDGRRIAAAAEREISVWETASGNRLCRVFGGAGHAVSPTLKTLISTDETAKLVQMQQVGGRFRVDKAGPLRIVDVESSKTVHEVPGYRIIVPPETAHEQLMCFLTFRTLYSPDGALLLAPGEAADEPNHGALCLWNATNGKRLPAVLYPGQVKLRDGVSFSPDGRLLAFLGSDGHIALLSTASGRVVRTLGREDRGFSALPVFTPDGRTLATVGDGSVRLWEVATGGEIVRREGQRFSVYSLVMAHDGRRLATVSGDQTILVWDLEHLSPKQGTAAVPLATCWSDLADTDARIGRQAVEGMRMHGAKTVAFLRERVQPAPPPNAKQLARLIAELGSDDFAARENAMHALEVIGGAAVPALREALAGKLSLEARRRMAQLLQTLDPFAVPTADALRAIRAVQILEMIADVPAWRLLEEWSRGAPGARLTEEALAALRRMP